MSGLKSPSRPDFEQDARDEDPVCGGRAPSKTARENPDRGASTRRSQRRSMDLSGGHKTNHGRQKWSAPRFQRPIITGRIRE